MDGLFILRLVCLCLVTVGSASAEGQRISAVIGTEATLPCVAKRYMPLKVVEWSRPDRNLEYVLIFNNQNQDLDIPEQTYQGRVELRNRENGDVSLVLKNVTAEDRGTYECYVLKKTNRRKRAPQPISIIHLDVAPPSGHGHIGLVVGVMFFFLILSTLTAVFVWKKKQSSSHSPDNEAKQSLQV